MTIRTHPRRGRAARGLIRCRGGAIAVETAFVLPVLIVLLLGIIETSFVLFAQHMLHGASYSTARHVSVRSIDPSRASDYARTQLPHWLREHLNVVVTQSAPQDPTANTVTVRLELPLQKATPISLVIASKALLTATANAKQEVPL